MNSPSRMTYAFKILSGLAVCTSLYWLGEMIFYMFSNIIDSEFSIFHAMFFILFEALFGFPAYLGLYFGYQGLKHADPYAIKGLIGTYCTALAFFLILSWETIVPGVDERSGPSPYWGLFNLAAIFIAVCVYWFSYRYFLRGMGHPCPPVRQSLPKWPFAFISIFIWLSGPQVFLEHFPVSGENSFILMVLGFGHIFAVFAFYKTGVWLFARDESMVEKPLKLTPDESH